MAILHSGGKIWKAFADLVASRLVVFWKKFVSVQTFNNCSLASTINQHLSEVTKHIPVLDQSRLDSLRNNLSPLPACYNVEIPEVLVLSVLHKCNTTTIQLQYNNFFLHCSCIALVRTALLSKVRIQNLLVQMVFVAKFSENWCTISHHQ